MGWCLSGEFPRLDPIFILCHFVEMGHLPKQLAEKPFSYREAVATGMTKYALTILLDQGIIERISNGIYIPSNFDSTAQEAQFHIATVQCGEPSCICLLSALDHYHVTDQIPKKVWIMVPQEKRVQADNLKLVRTRHPLWNVGIQKTRTYWITTLPRTLVECLLCKNRIGSTIVLEALKQALNERKTSLGDMIDVANQLGVRHRVYPYLETLAS